jgi:hypothetical protein
MSNTKKSRAAMKETVEEPRRGAPGVCARARCHVRRHIKDW